MTARNGEGPTVPSHSKAPAALPGTLTAAWSASPAEQGLDRERDERHPDLDCHAVPVTFTGARLPVPTSHTAAETLAHAPQEARRNGQRAGPVAVRRNHTITAGFYYGRYGIGTYDSSLVFPAAPDGTQTSTVPIRVVNNFRTHDILNAVYVNDLWRLSDRRKVNLGARIDTITGFSHDSQFDPTINLIWTPNRETTVHAGSAHYKDSPRFQGFSPNEQASFDDTTNAQPPGRVNPYAQHDTIWVVGVVQNFDKHFSMSFDAYYELNRYYSDEGQFGALPIFLGFNYDHGSAWGNELVLWQ